MVSASLAAKGFSFDIILIPVPSERNDLVVAAAAAVVVVVVVVVG